MIHSPPAYRSAETSIRQDGKQRRAFDGAGSVRVFSEGNYLVAKLNTSRDAEQIRQLLAAPNAVPVRKHGGRLVGIRLLSYGNDWGQAGERHGRSTVTTERVRNDAGTLVGSSGNLKHKAENVNHASPPPAWAAAPPHHRPVQAPLATEVRRTATT
jgi:hypothetical protein